MSNLLYFRGLLDNYRSLRDDVDRDLVTLDRHATAGKLTGPQTAQRDKLLKDKAYLDAEIDNAQRQMEESRSADRSFMLDAARGSSGASLEGGATGMQYAGGGTDGDADEFARQSNGVRDAARRTIEQAMRSGSLSDDAAGNAERLVLTGDPHERDVAAEWIKVTGDPAYFRAFQKLAADPQRGHLMWSEQERVAFTASGRVQALLAGRHESRAMSLTDANGGYLVPFQLDPSIIITNAGTTNAIAQVSRQVTATGDTWNGVSSSGVVNSWDAEAAEVSDDSPTLAQPSIPIHMNRTFVPISIEALMDGAEVVREVSRLIADEALNAERVAFTTGTGSGQPTGIITALTGTSSEINAAADDTFARGDVYNLQSLLGARYQAGASWHAHLSIINLMSQMETTAGARLFPEISDGRLLNRPLYENSSMDSSITTSGAVSNFALVYGDFQNYVIARRIGLTVEFIPHLFGVATPTNRPTGQRGWFAFFRAGADSVNDAAFRMLDVASAS
jgi:HK97 family phage major capsid protein